MNAAIAIRRPRFGFSLRMLFVLVTLCGVWLGWNVHVVRQRQAAIRWAKQDGGICLAPDDEQAQLPWIRRLLGDQALLVLHFNSVNQQQNDEYQRLFPEIRRVP